MNINQTIKLGLAVLSLIIAPVLAGQAHGQVVPIDHQVNVNDLNNNNRNSVGSEIGKGNRILHTRTLNSSPLTVPSG
jgi:hypothetical protein